MPADTTFELYKVTAPSGREISLSPEEEEEIVKQVIADEIMYQMNRWSLVQRSAISAVGTAAGIAIGGLIVGWFIGRSSGK